MRSRHDETCGPCVDDTIYNRWSSGVEWSLEDAPENNLQNILSSGPLVGLECGPVAYVCALPDTALSVVVVSSSSCGLDLLGWASLFTAHTSKCSGGVAQAAQNTYISAKTAFQSLSFETFAENSSILAGSVRPSTYIRMYTKGVWQSSGEEEETRESSSSPASGPPFKESKNEHILLWRPCANETDDGDDRH